MERMKRLSEKSEVYQITQEELSKRFETVETQSAELAAAPQRNNSILDSDIGLFIEDPAFIYQDFAKVKPIECFWKKKKKRVIFKSESEFKLTKKQLC